MRRVKSIVERSRGGMRFIPISELWEVSGLLADTFPLDRETLTMPRSARRAAVWSRLLLVDRAVTNREGTALLTLSETPWVSAAAAAGLAAVIVPKLPVWVRSGLFATVAVWAIRGGRLRRHLKMQRELARVAPSAVFVGDFVARQPGVGMSWAADMLATVDDHGEQVSYVALLPDSDDRRHRARERVYTRRLGFRVAGQTDIMGRPMRILVRG